VLASRLCFIILNFKIQIEVEYSPPDKGHISDKSFKSCRATNFIFFLCQAFDLDLTAQLALHLHTTLQGVKMATGVATEFSGHDIKGLASEYGTPLWAYSREVIEKQYARLKDFPIIRYAQKACPNIAILSLLRSHGAVVDAVTAGEVYRAQAAGYKLDLSEGDGPHQVVFTADIIDQDAAHVIREYSLPVNAGSSDMIEQLAELSPKSPLILRINPGFGHGHSRKTNTGGPLSKHGIWHEDLPQIFKRVQRSGLPLHGLHMHIGSGADITHLQQVAESMVAAARKSPVPLKMISAGGGLSIPYREDDAEELDLSEYVRVWKEAVDEISRLQGSPVQLELEPGRFLVAQAGILIAEIRAIKKNQDTLFYLIDAGFDTLIRPAMYGAYHRISVCHRTPPQNSDLIDVVLAGPLCESGDVFTQEEGGIVTTRKLPRASVGDLIVLHEAGAYGATMSSNYNSRRLAPEVLLSGENRFEIRSRQLYQEIFQRETIPSL
jgi:diaminopimelate decarboxylase